MGLFEFVFGKSAPKDDTAPKQSFYLNDDDAKSFGNIDYMRSTKVVRRTFAKKKGQKEHLESIRSISATKMTDVNGDSSSASVSAFTTFGNTDFLGDKKSESAPAKSEPTTSDSVFKAERPKRDTGTSMDMFRNMAKDIRK